MHKNRVYVPNSCQLDVTSLQIYKETKTTFFQTVLTTLHKQRKNNFFSNCLNNRVQTNSMKLLQTCLTTLVPLFHTIRQHKLLHCFQLWHNCSIVPNLGHNRRTFFLLAMQYPSCIIDESCCVFASPACPSASELTCWSALFLRRCVPSLSCLFH